MKNHIDLFLAGDIGLWALQQVSDDHIKNVISSDEQVIDAAVRRKLSVIVGNANKVDYENAIFGLSIHYPYILRSSLIAKYVAIYNLHPGYLPWGKGFYPIFWALWENTPAGATLHEIVPDVDRGPIIHQVLVNYTDADTGFSLFQRVREAEKQIFIDYLPRIIAGEVLKGTPQPEGGSFHFKREFDAIKRTSNWQDMPAEQLIRLIRCLTFPGYTGLEIEVGGKMFSVKLEDIPDVG
ncbi:MAG: formyltransferase family protein [Candidatus Flexifilum sp.]|jgi:methionyl-tRNA formyltransferase